jgi:ATP-dependent DNA helicase RecG
LERAGDIFCPDARYECKSVSVVNKDNFEDFILAIWVRFRADKLVETTDGAVFIRRGSSRRKLSAAETRELQNTKGQVETERESVSTKFPDDFKMQSLNQFLSAVREKRQIPDRLKAEKILELRKLGKITKDGFIPNLACALLFAKDPELQVPGCRIRFLRYAGTVEKIGENYNVIKDITVEGTIPDIIQETANIID